MWRLVLACGGELVRALGPACPLGLWVSGLGRRVSGCRIWRLRWFYSRRPAAQGQKVDPYDRFDRRLCRWYRFSVGLLYPIVDGCQFCRAVLEDSAVGPHY